jgi:hypothetical protein
MEPHSEANVRYVGMCIGDKNIWVSCPGVPLPERQPKKPSSILRLIKRLKQRPELFHVVAEPSKEFDLFELDVSAKFHEANIPITFVSRSWLYDFRNSLPDADRYYIDADLVELYGRKKRPAPNALPSPELLELASFARMLLVLEETHKLLAGLKEDSKSTAQAVASEEEEEAQRSFQETESMFREMLQQIPETYELVQKYCARTRLSESFAVLMLVTLPDAFHQEIGLNPEAGKR